MEVGKTGEQHMTRESDTTTWERVVGALHHERAMPCPVCGHAGAFCYRTKIWIDKASDERMVTKATLHIGCEKCHGVEAASHSIAIVAPGPGAMLERLARMVDGERFK